MGGKAAAVAAARGDGEGGGKKMLRLAPIKAGRRRTARFFCLRLAAAVTDGSCVRERASARGAGVYVSVRAIAVLIRQHFLGTREDVGEGPGGS